MVEVLVEPAFDFSLWAGIARPAYPTAEPDPTGASHKPTSFNLAHRPSVWSMAPPVGPVSFQPLGGPPNAMSEHTMHRLKMHLIPKPDWARRGEVSFFDGFPLLAYEGLCTKREELLALLQQAVQGYIDDPRLVADLDAEMFPGLDRLTGEYYISSESYGIATLGLAGNYWVSISTHCLQPGGSDHLGLEVHFTASIPDLFLKFHGDIDSSVI